MGPCNFLFWEFSTYFPCPLFYYCNHIFLIYLYMLYILMSVTPSLSFILTNFKLYVAKPSYHLEKLSLVLSSSNFVYLSS